MEDLQQINWSCIEITKTKKRFIVTVQNIRALRSGDSGYPDGHTVELYSQRSPYLNRPRDSIISIE